MNKPFRKTLAAEQIARFVAIVGERHAVTDPAEQEAFLVEPRGLYHGHTPLVLRPGSTDEVAAILTLASALGVPVVPQGGNTGLVGGQIPFAGEILLSLKRLDRIRDIDPASNTMTCEAGVVLQTAQTAAAAVDRLFPLSLGAEGSCTIGGNLSTNAGGTAALAYGVARDLVLGLEVVLPDGRIWHGLNKLKKDNTGYELKHLFMGAEGTLGVITAAVLKLFPAPKSVETAFVGLSSPEAALALLGLVQERAGGNATSFELLARICIEFAVEHGIGMRDPLASIHPWYVLVELSSGGRTGLRDVMEETLALGIERGLVTDAVMAESLEHRNAFWRLREFVSDAQRYEGGSIKQDVSVPVAAVPDFIRAATEAAERVVPGCRPVPFGHLGDGNIHFNVSQPVGADKAAYLARWDDMSDAVFAEVLARGGSISAEHGIGVMKRDYLPRVKDPVALDLMRTLKAVLDPKSILNPGKVV
ncbi:MAG: FAD-binding oxidoreductase [Rhodoplanes sp.]|uniref:FAD-binding oxidoreductase n=1 Tax=Rhodoplanes sp. TaxID=1968906 RepID=UPI0017E90EF5|nr:FAD-binding oxidoreductase [Rhodoplanes sp.]NVO15028.1 FAD-binding oxidoreductase [Rhodoplanes sp.]